MRRCASASPGMGTTRVGPVESVRRISAATCEAPTCETDIVLMPTAGSPRSWKPQAARNNVIPVAAGIQAGTLDNDVHQASGHHHHLLRLLSVEEPDNGLVRQRGRLDLLPCCA